MVRKHFEINKYGVFTKLNKYIVNDYIVHGNFYFKKKLLLAWLEFEIVINIRVFIFSRLLFFSTIGSGTVV